MTTADITRLNVELRHLRYALESADKAMKDLDIKDSQRDSWRADYFESVIKNAIGGINYAIKQSEEELVW